MAPSGTTSAGAVGGTGGNGGTSGTTPVVQSQRRGQEPAAMVKAATVSPVAQKK